MDYTATADSGASPSEIWPLFVDVEQWPTLTPSMQRVVRLDEGPLRVGSTARVKQPGLPASRWRVSEVDEGKGFTWVSKSGGVTSVASHVVEQTPAGARVTLSLKQAGPLSGLIYALMGKKIQRWVQLEADGFAHR